MGRVATDVELYKAARGAGFTADEAVTMTAIAIAESRGVLDAIGDDGSSFGPWQIHSGVPFPGWNTALSNAIAARAKYLVQGFNAWCTYFPTGCNGAARGHSTEQRHTTYIARGQAAAKGSGDFDLKGNDPLLGGIGLPGPLAPLDPLADALTGSIGDALGGLNPLNIFDPLIEWINTKAIVVFEVLAGLSLIALGLALLAFEGLL